MKTNTITTLIMAMCLTILGMIPPAHSRALPGDDDLAFIQEELGWREKRDKEMRAPTSWLNIAGLFWLKEGVNRFGTSEENPIKLPEGSAPPLAGSFLLDNGTVTMTAEQGTELKIDGNVYRLDAFSGKPKTLFFIFGDDTNGKKTYEASRFMNAYILEDGKVSLNFNRAFNPPCAYTPYATCPLPPRQNQLKISILAGEKKYPDSHH